MKKLFILYLLISSFQATHAQYKPLPMQNAEWYQDGGIALLNLNAVSTNRTLSDPCNEIRSVNHKKSKQQIVLNVEIYQSCLGTYIYKELVVGEK